MQCYKKNCVIKERMDSSKALEDATEWFSRMCPRNLIAKQFYEQFKNGKIIINDPKGVLCLPKELPLEKKQIDVVLKNGGNK